MVPRVQKAFLGKCLDPALFGILFFRGAGGGRSLAAFRNRCTILSPVLKQLKITLPSFIISPCPLFEHLSVPQEITKNVNISNLLINSLNGGEMIQDCRSVV